MMTMPRANSSRTQTTRLPGVYFLPPPPAAGTGLPPLDVAAFVGFAERGPVHLPTPVEDTATYTAIFGGDLALAEAADGTVEYAYLPGSVASFFANGGRRCYVVRVAEKQASCGVFCLPGMVALSGSSASGGSNSERASFVTASSEGAWSDSLCLTPRLVATPLPVHTFTPEHDGTLRWNPAGAPSTLEPGDLLRLTFTDGTTLLFPMDTVGVLPDTADEKGYRLLSADAVYPVLTASALSGGSRSVTALRRLTPTGAEPLPVPSGSQSPLQLGLWENRLALDIPDNTGSPDHPLRPGDLLSVDFAGSVGSFLLTIAEIISRKSPAGSVPADATMRQALAEEIVGARVSPASLPVFAASPTRALVRVERLRLGLLLREGNVRTFRMEEMGFGAAHSQFWGYAILRGSSPLADTASRSEPRSDFPASASGQPFDDYRDQPQDSPAAVAATRFFTLHNVQATDTDSDTTIADVDLLAARLSPLTKTTATTTVFLPVGMAPLFTEEGFVGPTTSGEATTQKFGPCVFLDSHIVPNPLTILDAQDSLLSTARDRRYIQGYRLQGIHSLLFVEEVAMIAVPDAVHPDWPAPSSTPPPSSTVEPSPPPPDLSQFHLCASPPAEKTPIAKDMEVPPKRLPQLVAPTPEVGINDTILVLQHALFSVCQARQDAVAVLTLPRHYETRQCTAWQETFRNRLGLPPRRTVSRDTREIADLSYAAVFHPWIYLSDGTRLRNGAASLRATPPDGTICGLIAARERQRQVWVAPANVVVSGALDLTPTLTTDDWADLFALQFNLIRREPGDFRLMSAHTLSDQAELLQISVRRLMILLRKAAYERGMDYVFEPNSDAFRESVRLSLESLLREMYRGGAFRGDNEANSFLVDVGPSVNPPESVDRGYFIVRIQVAPSQPMEFITVTLKRVGGNFTVAEA